MTDISAKLDEEIAKQRLMTSHLVQISKEAAWDMTIHQLEIDALKAECKRLEEVNAELLAVLEDAERVMGQHIYPKPDVDDDHPYAVLKRMRAAIAKARGES